MQCRSSLWMLCLHLLVVLHEAQEDAALEVSVAPDGESTAGDAPPASEEEERLQRQQQQKQRAKFLKGYPVLMRNFPKLRREIFNLVSVMGEAKPATFINTGWWLKEDAKVAERLWKELRRLVETLKERFSGRLEYDLVDATGVDHGDHPNFLIWNPGHSNLTQFLDGRDETGEDYFMQEVYSAGLLCPYENQETHDIQFWLHPRKGMSTDSIVRAPLMIHEETCDRRISHRQLYYQVKRYQEIADVMKVDVKCKVTFVEEEGDFEKGDMMERDITNTFTISA